MSGMLIPPLPSQQCESLLGICLSKKCPYLKVHWIEGEHNYRLSAEGTQNTDDIRVIKYYQTILFIKLINFLKSEEKFPSLKEFIEEKKNGGISTLRIKEGPKIETNIPKILPKDKEFLERIESQKHPEIHVQVRIIVAIFADRIHSFDPTKQYESYYRNCLIACLDFHMNGYFADHPSQEDQERPRKLVVSLPLSSRDQSPSKREPSPSGMGGSSPRVLTRGSIPRQESPRPVMKQLSNSALQHCFDSWIHKLQNTREEDGWKREVSVHDNEKIISSKILDSLNFHSYMEVITERKLNAPLKTVDTLAADIDRHLDKVIMVKDEQANVFTKNIGKSTKKELLIGQKKRFESLLTFVDSSLLKEWEKCNKGNKDQEFVSICKTFLTKCTPSHKFLSVLTQSVYIFPLSIVRRIFYGISFEDKKDTLQLKYMLSEKETEFQVSMKTALTDFSFPPCELELLNKLHYKEGEGWSSGIEFFLHLDQNMTKETKEYKIIRRKLMHPLEQAKVKYSIIRHITTANTHQVL